MILVLVEQLRKDGTLKKLVEAGLISGKVYTYHEMVMFFDVQRRLGHNTNKATGITEDAFRCSRSTVFRALRAFKYEYCGSDSDKRG